MHFYNRNGGDNGHNMVHIEEITAQPTSADPNGEEAGLAFLEANKAMDGVIVLPSNLQYKVLKEGTGKHHPALSSPCECHYAGRLMDGTVFDSSYKRGKPSTFSPQQVIKGWTEAMMKMVVGDEWELCTCISQSPLPSTHTLPCRTCTRAHTCVCVPCKQHG